MRGGLAKAVRDRFDTALARQLPPLRKVASTVKGSRLYQWKVGKKFWVFVLLYPHHLGDVFVVEIAWTKGQPFPGGYSSATASSEKAFERFRLYELWTERAPLDLWWIGGRPRIDPNTGDVPALRPEHELISEAEAAADDAATRVVAFAVPYLSKIAKHLGYEISERPHQG